MTRWYHHVHSRAEASTTLKPYVFVIQPGSCWKNSEKSPSYVDKQCQEVWQVKVTEK